jgi:hypothetical protein
MNVVINYINPSHDGLNPSVGFPQHFQLEENAPLSTLLFQLIKRTTGLTDADMDLVLVEAENTPFELFCHHTGTRLTQEHLETTLWNASTYGRAFTATRRVFVLNPIVRYTTQGTITLREGGAVQVATEHELDVFFGGVAQLVETTGTVANPLHANNNSEIYDSVDWQPTVAASGNLEMALFV